MTDSKRYRFELITEAHDVSDFACENFYLTKFLQKDALPETQADLSRTYLLLDSENAGTHLVVGFFTLHADSIYATREGTNAGTYLYPLIYLAALARDVRRKGEGMGDLLLLEAFRYAVSVGDVVGVAGIHLDTTLQGRRLYTEYGFGEHPEGGNKLLISLADVRTIVLQSEVADG